MMETVFVVEGDWDVRCALGDTLEDEGWRPVLFGKAEDLPLALEENQPSFLVLDLHLPGMSGSELLLALHKRPAWARVPTAVFTAWRDLAVPHRLNIPVVMKPDVAGLLQLIRSVLALRSVPIDSRPARQLGAPGSALAGLPAGSGGVGRADRVGQQGLRRLRTERGCGP